MITPFFGRGEVRFLIDAQLPPAFATYLRTAGHEAEHVYEIGLANAADTIIWAYATDARATLISKDEDFALMRIRNTSGPAVIWIRVGNTTRRELIARFEEAAQDIFAALERGEALVEFF